jgi:hypothetical protein
MSQHEYHQRLICQSDFFTLRQHLDGPSSGVVQPYHDQYDSTSTSRHCQVASTAPLPTWLDSTVASMTWQHCRQHDSPSTLYHSHVVVAAPSSEWLNSTIVSMTRHLHNASMTRHLYHATINVTSAVLSPVGFDNTIISMTQHLHHVAAMSLRQRHHQNDSTSPSSAWLEIYIVPAWLDIYITSWPTSPRQRRHQQDSTVSSLPGLSGDIASMTRQHRRQHDSTAPSPAWLDIDVTQQLDHQHQQYMASMASRHATSSYQFYSQLCLISGSMQASHCTAWYLREASTFQKFTFEDFKLWTLELNSQKDLIQESNATSNKCIYAVPIFD